MATVSISGASDAAESDDAADVMRGVGRAVAVLEYLASQGGPCGPSEIARETGLSKAVVLRLLRTWAALGYAISKDGSYQLGWRIFTLVAARSEAHNLQAAARRYLEALNEESGETVHLSVIVGHDAIYVDKLEGRQAIRVYTAIGRRGPLHATASGKAILAHFDAARVARLVRGHGGKLTDRTLAEPAELQEDLRLTRERGYSVNVGEWHADVGGVGAAIFDRDGLSNAALSITFPMSTTDGDRISYLGGLVKNAAEALSRERGWLKTRAG